MRVLSLLAVTATLLFSSMAARAEPIGTQYAAGNINANTTIQVVAPASNVGGIYIRTCILVSEGNSNALLYAVMPDGTQREVYAAAGTTSTTIVTGVMPYPLYFPPGVGVSVYAGSANAGAYYMTYDTIS